MPTEVPKRIHLLGSGRVEEGVAGAAFTPGHLVALNSDGEYIKHATEGGYAEKIFAVEDALQGREIDTAYAHDERATVVIAAPGDVVYAWLAAGETVTPATLLASKGDGTLKAVDGTNIALAKPLDTLDLTQSGDVDTRLRVRLL